MKFNIAFGFLLSFLLFSCVSFSVWAIESEEEIQSSASAVPLIPNEAILKGVVKEYCLTSSGLAGMSPEQTLYKMVILVEVVEDVNDYMNFLKGREKQSLKFYSKEKLFPELFGEKIKALVEYRGDERGGNFWIKHIEIIK